MPRNNAVADGVRMTRDLTNEPANVLTTTEFADRLVEMKELGLEVEVLDEDKLEKLGHAHAAERRAGLGQPLEGCSDAVERRRQGRCAAGIWSVRAWCSTLAVSH